MRNSGDHLLKTNTLRYPFVQDVQVEKGMYLVDCTQMQRVNDDNANEPSVVIDASINQ